jgi:hypothetical protein
MTLLVLAVERASFHHTAARCGALGSFGPESLERNPPLLDGPVDAAFAVRGGGSRRRRHVHQPNLRAGSEALPRFAAQPCSPATRGQDLRANPDRETSLERKAKFVVVLAARDGAGVRRFRNWAADPARVFAHRARCPPNGGRVLRRPHYCSLDNSDSTRNVGAAGALALSGPRMVVAHFALHSAEVDPFPAGAR